MVTTQDTLDKTRSEFSCVCSRCAHHFSLPLLALPRRTYESDTGHSFFPLIRSHAFPRTDIADFTFLLFNNSTSRIPACKKIYEADSPVSTARRTTSVRSTWNQADSPDTQLRKAHKSCLQLAYKLQGLECHGIGDSEVPTRSCWLTKARP